MADVRSKIGAPILDDFNSSSGTPIVCNQTTGGISVLKADSSIQEMALVAGSASQTFSVSPATAATHAARLDNISLYPTVASATSPDIFGAAGATINYTGTTTATSFVACTSAQIGSLKRIIPASDTLITASASLKVDGNTSGNYLLLAGSIVNVIATSTTTFQVIRSLEYVKPTDWTATFTCATVGNLSVTGASQSCKYSILGDVVTIVLHFSATITHTTASGVIRITGLPATIAPPTNQISGALSFSGITSAGYTQLSTQMTGDSDIYFTKSGSGVARSNVAITDIPSGGTLSLSAIFNVLLTPN